MAAPFMMIVGLGNPGPRYARNRHNIGFQCVDLLAQRARLNFDRVQFRASLGMGEVAGVRVLLAKPQTFMNLSGQAVVPLLRYYKVEPADMLVLYDELDLPLGRLRLRAEGGAGGHNGMKSIIGQLGSQTFARLRIGIGRPPGRMEPADYVLQDFTNEQEIEMAFVRPRVVEGIVTWLRDGIDAAMNQLNA